MIVDFDTCEWDRPGANPSMVTIEQAVARGVPEADRAELLRQFHARERFDMVRIHRDRIYSERGTAQYAAVISNMNFGTGGLCRTVTRKTWSNTDYQGAMVFKVNGHFYGYAAVCRNLFTMLGRETPAATPPAALVPGGGETFTAAATPEAPVAVVPQPQVIVVTETITTPGVVEYVPVFLPGPPIFIGGGPVTVITTPVPVPTPIPAVPEPSTWAMLMCGLAGLFAATRRRCR